MSNSRSHLRALRHEHGVQPEQVCDAIEKLHQQRVTSRRYAHYEQQPDARAHHLLLNGLTYQQVVAAVEHAAGIQPRERTARPADPPAKVMNPEVARIALDQEQRADFEEAWNDTDLRVGEVQTMFDLAADDWRELLRFIGLREEDRAVARRAAANEAQRQREDAERAAAEEAARQREMEAIEYAARVALADDEDDEPLEWPRDHEEVMAARPPAVPTPAPAKRKPPSNVGINRAFIQSADAKRDRLRGVLQRYGIDAGALRTLYDTRTIQEIADHYGVSVNDVYVMLGILDVPLRGGSRIAAQQNPPPWPEERQGRTGPAAHFPRAEAPEPESTPAPGGPLAATLEALRADAARLEAARAALADEARLITERLNVMAPAERQIAQEAIEVAAAITALEALVKRGA